MTLPTNAAMLTLLLLFAQAAAPPAPVPGDIVAGTVLSARDQHPIAHATVVLFDETTQITAVSAYTDETGHYQLPPVPDGKYSLSAAAPGYITANYLQHDRFSTAIITGAGLPTSALTLTLAPAATISGSVTDESDPIINASVELFREDLTSADRISSYKTSVAPRGSFEFTDLPPGRYYLCATGDPWYSVIPRRTLKDEPTLYRVSVDPALQVVYPPVYYPNALDSNDATPIEIHPGEQFTANLRMTPQHPVSFVVHLPPTLKDAVDNSPKEARMGSVVMREYQPVGLSHMVFGKEEPVPANFDEQDGTLVADGLLPGRYFVSQVNPDGGNATRVSEVDLTNPSTSLSLSALSPQAAVSVTLRGSHKPSEDAPETTVTLHDLQNPQSSLPDATQGIDEKGEALFASLPPSDYRFSVSVPAESGDSRDLHIETVNINGRPSLDKQLHLTGKGKLTVVLTVTETRVTVQCLALHEGKPAPGAMIVLVPAGPDAHADLFRRDQSDLDGTFNLIDAEPGKYILIAIEDGWPLRWDDITTLTPYLAHGIPVNIPTTATGNFHIQTPVQTVLR